MNAAPTRWGILSTAEIARKNWKAIRNSGNAIVVAVASRELSKSQRFIQKCQSEAPFAAPPRALGSYEELLASPDIDAVYIPLPTGLRKEWVIRAAEAGKHVVCEKPCAANLAELEAMLEACRRHRVQFMDGVMFMHGLRLESMRAAIDDPANLGRIQRIQTGFSFCAPPSFFEGNIRSSSALEPQGCLGDLGWYCLRFTLWALNWKLPTQVTGRILSQIGRADSPSPVPTEFSGELLYDGGPSAGFYCAFTTELQQWAIVSGTRGYLKVSDYVLPYFGRELEYELHQARFEVSGCEFQMHPGLRTVSVNEPSNSDPQSQEARLFRHFSTQVKSGKLNEDWPMMALRTQQVMEACLRSARQGSQPVRLSS